MRYALPLLLCLAVPVWAQAPPEPAAGQVWWSTGTHEPIEVVGASEDCRALRREMRAENERVSRMVAGAFGGRDLRSIPDASDRQFALEMSAQQAPFTNTEEEGDATGPCVAYGKYLEPPDSTLRLYTAMFQEREAFLTTHVYLGGP